MKIQKHNSHIEIELKEKEEIIRLKKIIQSKTETIQKLEETIKQYGLSIKNDTSSSFLLPSEFKSKWENFTKNTILETFENTFDDPQLLTFITQETMNLLYQLSINDIYNKIESIMKILNIEDITIERKKTFFYKMRFIFQEYFSSIFKFNDYNKIKSHLSGLKISNQKKKELLNDLQTTQFNSLLEEGYKICSYMNLHQPRLSFKENSFVYLYYSKKYLNNIEGFGKENSVCLVTLFPPLLRNNFFYQGIKPAVYVINHPTKEMINECEKNKEIYDFSNKSRSCSEDSKININQELNKNSIQNTQVLFKSKSSNNFKGDNKRHSARERQKGTNKSKLISLSFNSKNNDDQKLDSLRNIKKNFIISQPLKNVHTIQIDHSEHSLSSSNISIESNSISSNIKKIIGKNNNFGYLKINYVQKKKESKYNNSKDGTIINTPKNNKYIKKIEKTNRIHIPIINNTKLLKENNLLTERKTSFEIIHYN